ncbi:MAG TPA: c-type cytochrome [Acidimicrobiia bacterium]
MSNPRTRSGRRRAVALSTVMTGALLLGACSAPAGDLPPPLEAGRDVFRSVCSTCHGDSGQGLSGPSLDGVLETFPACDDQLKWIMLGSEEWKSEVGPTYGAQDKAITEIMPGFASSLSETQVEQVAAYVRAAFGEEEQTTAMSGCGA